MFDTWGETTNEDDIAYDIERTYKSDIIHLKGWDRSGIASWTVLDYDLEDATLYVKVKCVVYYN